MANPLTITGWAYDAGFTTLGVLTDATALALAGPGVESAAGMWQVGGTPGDGPSQAAAARAAYLRAGWSEFPAHSGMSWMFYRPGAAAAAAAILSQRATAEAGRATVETARDAGASVGATVGEATGLSSVTDAVRWLSQPSTWVRVAKFILGMSLMTVGAVMLVSGRTPKQVRDQSTAAAGKVAAAVVTKGKA